MMMFDVAVMMMKRDVNDGSCDDDGGGERGPTGEVRLQRG